MNMVFGIPVFYLYPGIIGYRIFTIVGYWTNLLSTDPPLLVDLHEPSSTQELISIGFQKLLPLCFVLYVGWKCSVKKTLEKGSPVSKSLFWYTLFCLGVLNNVAFD